MSEATLEVRFADLGWPIFSPLISLTTSHWANHCDLMTDGGRMISAIPGGVREWSCLSLHARRSSMAVIPCTLAQREVALAFARSKIGTGYDYGAVLSFGWGAPWADRKRWFCSELVAASLAAAGLISPTPAARVSPGALMHIIKGAA